MRLFVKNHWPIPITLGLMFVIGVLYGTAWFGDALFSNDTFGSAIVLFIFLLVVMIYGEIFYFIYKAAKHKELKEKVWWCVGIYCLHIFLIPYFNLKYICNNVKIKFNMLYYIVLSVFVFIFGFLCPWLYNVNKEPLLIRDRDNLVEMKFLGGYHEKEVGEYDIYVSDTSRLINFGVFVYDENDADTPEKVMESRDTWINNTRSPVEVVSKTKEELEDRIITTNIYIGTNEGSRYMYFISTVEFKNTDVFINSLGIYLYDDYLKYKSELKNILVEMEYIGSRKEL